MDTIAKSSNIVDKYCLGYVDIIVLILIYSIDCVVFIVSVLKYYFCTKQYLREYCGGVCLIVYYNIYFIVYVIVHDIVISYC